MASPLSKAKPNLRSTAVKRIMQEAAELARDAEGESDFVAAPLEVRIRNLTDRVLISLGRSLRLALYYEGYRGYRV